MLIKLVKYFAAIIKKCVGTLIWGLKALVTTDLKNHINKGNYPLLSILANGPSLSEELESIDLHNGDFSVLNFFYKSPLFNQIKPSIYVLADPYFFTEEHIKPIFDLVHWSMTLFVPYRYWKRIHILRNCPNSFIKVLPYHTGHYLGYEFFRIWIYRHGLSMPIAQNVLVPSIFNAINLGYKEIRIYGADHSWTKTIRVNAANEVCLVDSHFYDNNEEKLKPWKKLSGETYLMHEVLRDLAQMFDSYHYIRKYADEAGCRIINCTKNSFIDAFERAN